MWKLQQPKNNSNPKSTKSNNDQLLTCICLTDVGVTTAVPKGVVLTEIPGDC